MLPHQHKKSTKTVSTVHSVSKYCVEIVGIQQP